MDYEARRVIGYRDIERGWEVVDAEGVRTAIFLWSTNRKPGQRWQPANVRARELCAALNAGGPRAERMRRRKIV